MDTPHPVEGTLGIPRAGRDSHRAVVGNPLLLEGTRAEEGNRLLVEGILQLGEGTCPAEGGNRHPGVGSHQVQRGIRDNSSQEGCTAAKQ